MAEQLALKCTVLFLRGAGGVGKGTAPDSVQDTSFWQVGVLDTEIVQNGKGMFTLSIFFRKEKGIIFKEKMNV